MLLGFVWPVVEVVVEERVVVVVVTLVFLVEWPRWGWSKEVEKETDRGGVEFRSDRPARVVQVFGGEERVGVVVCEAQREGHDWEAGAGQGQRGRREEKWQGQSARL